MEAALIGMGITLYSVIAGFTAKAAHKIAPDELFEPNMAPYHFVFGAFWPVFFPALIGVKMFALFDSEKKHQRKLEQKRRRIERAKELRQLDEEYERELDNLIEGQ